jgi:hypothetical protein
MAKQATTKSVDKVYRLTNGQTPLSFVIPVRNTSVSPLLWFDEENNMNRALRYASNQKTPFEDEQDGNIIVEPVVFVDGMLRVPRTNPVLQQFLSLHPMNGIMFEEVNNERDAAQEVEEMNVEVDALIEAKSLSIEELETVYRVLFDKSASDVGTAELRRDVLVYAKRSPANFLDIVRDPVLRYKSTVKSFFENKYLVFKNGKKEVWFNTDSNKKKLMSIPYGQDPYDLVGAHLQSDEGLDALKLLNSLSK